MKKWTAGQIAGQSGRNFIVSGANSGLAMLAHTGYSATNLVGT